MYAYEFATGKNLCILLCLAAYVIYVLLLGHAYMLVFSPIGEGILVYECSQVI
jgi:hypothetical protein